MKKLIRNQKEFVPLILALLIVVVAVIDLVYLRTLKAHR